VRGISNHHLPSQAAVTSWLALVAMARHDLPYKRHFRLHGCDFCSGKLRRSGMLLHVLITGMNLTLTNYLLLALAAFQFPFLLWCTNVQLPQFGSP